MWPAKETGCRTECTLSQPVSTLPGASQSLVISSQEGLLASPPSTSCRNPLAIAWWAWETPGLGCQLQPCSSLC